MVVRVVKFHVKNISRKAAKAQRISKRIFLGVLGVRQNLVFGKFPDAPPDFGKRVAAVRREVLRDAERREKFRVVRQDFRRRVAAVKAAEQAGDGLDDERIGVATEETFAVAKFCDEPEFGEAAGNQIFIHAQFRRKRRTGFCFLDEEREAVLSVFQRGQLRREFNLFSARFMARKFF